MRSRLLKSCGALVATAAMIAGMSTTVYAIDANNRFFAYGVGQRSCDDYIKFREKRLDVLEKEHERYTQDELYDIVNRIVEQWIAGFLTAHNLYVSDTYDVAAKSDMNDLKARIEKVCGANPKQRLVEAVIAVVQQLNPQRVKVERAK